MQSVLTGSPVEIRVEGYSRIGPLTIRTTGLVHEADDLLSVGGQMVLSQHYLGPRRV